MEERILGAEPEPANVTSQIILIVILTAINAFFCISRDGYCINKQK